MEKLIIYITTLLTIDHNYLTVICPTIDSLSIQFSCISYGLELPLLSDFENRVFTDSNLASAKMGDVIIANQMNVMRIYLISCCVIILSLVTIIVYLVMFHLPKKQKAPDEENRKSTDKKKVEELEQSLKELNSKLKESERYIEMGMMTTWIAHEINNPLNFISGGIQALLLAFEKQNELIGSQNIDSIPKEYFVNAEEIMKLFGIINSGITRTNKTVENIKFYSTLNRPELYKVNIKSCVLVAYNNLLNKIKEKGGEVNISIPDDLNVLANDSLFVQVIIILLDNAFYSIRDLNGKGRIEVIAIKDQHNAIISVRDNGHGFGTNVAIEKFDITCIPNLTAAVSRLGLLISNQIVKSFKGNLGLQSQKMQWTEYHISLEVYK